MSNWADQREAKYQRNSAEVAKTVCAHEGPGVTRADKRARTKLYKVKIIMDGYRSMTLSFHAESKAKAVKYAKNRWPSAQVEVLL